jgi:competence protein ComEA
VAVILAVVALVVAVPRALFTEPDVEPVPLPSQPAPTAAVVRVTGDAVPASTPSPADVVPLPTPGGAPVFVHVVGQVRHPGLVRLESGARLADALRKAGGPTRRADLARVNLARLVADGEQIFVPRPGQAPPVAQPGPAGGAAASPGPSAPVDLNTADEAALDALPGVGPVIAGRIVAWRQEHGRFTSVEELTEVSGIGDATLDRLRPLVRT